MWPDLQPTDAFWLESTLDQARTVLGRLTPDHQVQVEQNANKPYTLVISRDGLHQYALPYIEHQEEDPWPPEVFVPVTPFEVLDLAELQTACQNGQEEVAVPEVLSLAHAMAYYDTLQTEVTEEDPYRAVAGLASVTWPVHILLSDEEDEGWIIREQAQGMEQYLWNFSARENLREAVQLTVIMRNLLHWGGTDVPGGGYDEHLQHSLTRVSETNAKELGAETPE